MAKTVKQKKAEEKIDEASQKEITVDQPETKAVPRALGIAPGQALQRALPKGPPPALGPAHTLEGDMNRQRAFMCKRGPITDETALRIQLDCHAAFASLASN